MTHGQALIEHNIRFFDANPIDLLQEIILEGQILIHELIQGVAMDNIEPIEDKLIENHERFLKYMDEHLLKA